MNKMKIIGVANLLIGIIIKFIIENELLDFLKIVCDMNNIVLKNDQFIDSDFDTISKYIGKDNLNQNDVIFNCRLIEGKYTPTKIVEYLNNLFGNISIIKI